MSSPSTKHPDTDGARRLALLQAYEILDGALEREFDDAAMIAAAVCRTSMAFVSFSDDSRQRFKGRSGFEADDILADPSIFHDILVHPNMLVIPDLAMDSAHGGSDLFRQLPQVRFYASVPITAPDGTAIGTLAVMDDLPRAEGLAQREEDALWSVARQILALLQARRAAIRNGELVRRREGNLTSLQHGASNALLTHESEKQGTFDIDIRTDTIAVSAGMCRIFGVPIQKQFSASFFEEFTIPEDRDLRSSARTRADASAATNVVYRIRTLQGELKWIARSAVFELDDFGSPVRMLGTLQDITEKKAAIRMEAMIDLGDRLRDLDDVQSVVLVASDLMAKSLDAIRAGFGIVDPVAETITVRNEWLAPGVASVAGLHRFREYGDYIDDLKKGQTVVILNILEDPRTRHSPEPFLALGVKSMVNLPIMDHGQLDLVVLVHHSRPYAWSEEELVFIRSFGDRVQLAIARLQAERDQDTLNREIGHRLKNTFAMVQAIAQQTLRGVSERHLVSSLGQRLAALSNAHDILLSGEHQGTTVREVVEGFTRTMSVENRIDIDGPEVTLGSRGTLSLSLLLHELGTNAIKYGSLSNEDGRVDVSWRVDGEGDSADFHLTWTEIGGPPAHKPERKGFGSKLIGMGLIGTGGVATHYGEDGFSAQMTANLLQLERAN